MSGARDAAPRVRSGEMARMALGGFWPRDAVGRAMQHDRRHADRRLRGKPPLDCSERRIACRIAVPHAIRMDDYLDKIWVVECGRARLEQRFVEWQLQRPELPQQFRDLAPVLRQP